MHIGLWQRVCGWLEQRVDDPLAQAENRFRTLTLHKQNIASTKPKRLDENQHAELRDRWQSAKAVSGQRADLLLAAMKEHFDQVVGIDRPNETLFDRLSVILAAQFDTSESPVDLGRYEPDHKWGSQPVQLVLGDLSGIQNYLFAIAHTGEGGVAKRLRSRSFHLSMLPRTAAMYILDHFGLSYRHILMTTGGTFMLLLPDECCLDEVRPAMETYLYHRYHAALQLHLAAKTILPQQLNGVSQTLSALHADIQRSKARPFAALLVNEAGEWNERLWLHHRGEGDYCISCRHQPVINSSSSDAALCEDCVEDERIGRMLPQAGYTLYWRYETRHDRGSPWSGQLLWDRYGVSLLPTMEDVHRSMGLGHKDARPVCLEYWQDAAQTLSSFKLLDCWQQCAFVSNYIPNHNGIPLTFEEIAALSHGKSALGVYKADLDRLGLLLSFGLRAGADDYSLAEYLHLSRRLERFFGATLTSELKRLYPDLYTVFSGGDDLFLIGPWSQMPDFAEWMRQTFAAFAENEEITISAGFAIVATRTPIAHSAGDAENQLKEAKQYANPLRGPNASGRNQVAVCGRLMEWDDLVSVWKQVKQWAEWVDQSICSHGFLRKLLDLSRMYSDYRYGGLIDGLKYNAMLAYTVNRLSEARGPKEPLYRALVAWTSLLRQYDSREAERQWHLLPTVYQLFLLYKEKEGKHVVQSV